MGLVYLEAEGWGGYLASLPRPVHGWAIHFKCIVESKA
jgi:hypothetical protein